MEVLYAAPITSKLAAVDASRYDLTIDSMTKEPIKSIKQSETEGLD